MEASNTLAYNQMATITAVKVLCHRREIIKAFNHCNKFQGGVTNKLACMSVSVTITLV
jgi:hypothetical protein